MLVLFIHSLAFAGYGDALDGAPTYEERDVHMWTNAVRVAPTDFNDGYNEGGCNTGDFTSSERQPKSPLLFNRDLYEAARYHSNDMDQHDWFSHDSFDGTDFGTRVDRYYDNWSAIAENIAYGYADGYDVVVRGWMCSSGHRVNIMADDYNEMGVGVVGTYYTQDFGHRNSAPDHALKMGCHTPEVPSGSVTLTVDVGDSQAPSEVIAVLNGEEYDMSLWVGTNKQGVYAVDANTTAGCNDYFFVALDGGTEVARFPETGRYGWGNCSFDDVAAKWLAGQPALSWETTQTTTTETTDTTGTTGTTDDTGTDDTTLSTTGGQGGPNNNQHVTTITTTQCGCAAPVGAGSLWLLGSLPLLFVRRRR